MGKAAKSTKKFAASGQLKKVIQARHKHQQIRKRTQGRKGAGKGKKNVEGDDGEHDGEEDGEEVKTGKSTGKKSVKGMTVDDFLGGAFMEGEADSDVEDTNMDSGDGSDEAEDDDDIPDDESFASVDEFDGEEGEAHLLELSKLAEKDPEFYKYLQENDHELLDFDPATAKNDSDSGSDNAGDDDDDDDIMMAPGEEDEDMEEERMPILTTKILRKWQKGILEHRSLRALRKLLIAFRAAAHMNEDDQVLAWSIDSGAVYNKLVTTALRYTPVVLAHHAPYKTLSTGKFKPPTQTPKLKALQKLIIAYFQNVIHLLSQLTDKALLQTAVTESAKIVPYIVSSRKAVKGYLKKCLELWSSEEDSIRIAAFLAIRRLGSATDESIMDHVMKGTYLTLIRSSKATTPYTLPGINLMKNSASEIFCLDHATAYQHAFGYIRQLAIHLRNSMKVKTKDAYKLVYNWQYVHCVDFWCIVLARACDAEAEIANGGQESELKPLIYPLIQVSLGAIKLISNSRSYPLHLHLIRSLLHLTKHTRIYVPLAPYLIPILSSTLSPTSKPKPSTLRPLDLELQIRAPQQYLKTIVYAEGLIEETTFLLAEWLSGPGVHGSVAFPEVVVPVVVALRRAIKGGKSGKGSGSGKLVGVVRGLVERVEESAIWAEQRRKKVTFGPGDMRGVQEWERELVGKLGDSPLGKYVKVQRKTREKRRQLVEKAREGQDEILED